MRRLLVCQHVAYEILGTLNPLFKSCGFRIRYVNFGRYPDAHPSLEGYHGLVVLGGPMNANQVDQYPHLSTEINLIKQAIHKGIPILGICLGAQLIANALGAKVNQNQDKEIGWYDVSLTEEGKRDPLLGHFQDTEKIFQWHGDTFEIPHEAEQLAVSPTCLNQAFRFGTNVYGLQFHLEVDEPLIERWLRVPIHKKEIESLKGKVDLQRIRQETTANIDRLKQLSSRTFGEFIKLFGIKERRQRLSSR
ncbi:MAG: gamma-glutamyl-gamma-aminobutyrate hydrolase family protein [Deltaproteobacteria bacterium]|nr:gamma-glutamyl-gamma-aminobutyrate hydrolase family protein [Deltaproteobacteria bacterium]